MLARWRGRLDAPRNASEFVPPPRFTQATFASYRIDPAIAGQATAVAAVQDFAVAGRRRTWHWYRRKERPGLYLDGDFGVGKTHLLAAAWHAAAGVRRYLAFAEAISLVVQLGPAEATELLAGDLLCLDEFELDDPSNTRLADLLIDGLVRRGTRLVVTSNTVPGELGEGRMFVAQFRAQLNRVAAAFADVHVPGKDFRARHRFADGRDPAGWGAQQAPLPGAACISLSELDQFLQGIPVVSLRRLAEDLPGLTITDVHPIPDQLQALRLVHLVDRLYDWQVPLRVQASCRLDELFQPDYRELGYAKKYRRCLSRLGELCGESAQVLA